MDCTELQIKSVEYRRSILNIIKQANAGHTGGSLSCIDILNVLYNCILNVSPENFTDPNRDRYIHSKGHSVEALYVVLADKGFFPPSQLSTLEQYLSELIGHPTKKIPGIEQNTGALGHGLSVAVGMAIAGKIDRLPYRVFTMMGDGELTEGSIWEAAMSASHYQLDNLTAIIDRNGLQISGFTENVMRLEPLAERFRSFGFSTLEVDGHDFEALHDVFNRLPFEPGKPNLIIAHTIKGKGISFIENQVKWHHHVPNEVEFASAMQELNLSEEWSRNGAKIISR
jgi:transketolase